MKFAVGYQLPNEDEEPFVEVVREFRDRIEEVYFPWVDIPSGRSPMATANGFDQETARRMLEAEIAEIRGMGVKLDLLLNASCYGYMACSREFAGQVRRIVAHLLETVGLEVVTTMSPMIAEVVKKDFSEIDIRASVNMRLGTVKAMEYVAHLFDSYYVQRELNRDPERLAELKDWADAHGKGLYMLANSGCLNWCSVQTYHDNLVSHERDIDVESALDSLPLCWYLYHDRTNWVRFLQNSWI
ncbi:MAG: hypothetical protein KAU28_09505, partial [Phycisphaerae bacterium]|nr:hypothetical protein [Phycisphaerae bacterium]